METKWPDEVPVLEADDICFLTLNGVRGRHCLTGWSGVAFHHNPYETPISVARAIVESAGELCPPLVESLRKKHLRSKVFDINDLLMDGKKVARIWNRAMAKLGYVVGNPEAKYLKRKK